MERSNKIKHCHYLIDTSLGYVRFKVMQLTLVPLAAPLNLLQGKDLGLDLAKALVEV